MIPTRGGDVSGGGEGQYATRRGVGRDSGMWREGDGSGGERHIASEKRVEFGIKNFII